MTNYQAAEEKPLLAAVDDEAIVGSLFKGRYRILSHMGKGGMGAVYKAEHLLTQNVCALKVLRCESRSAAAVRRFRQEAKVLGKLNHANIIDLRDYDVTEDGLPFLVMDYVEGQSLFDDSFVANLTLDQLLDIFIQLCDALNHAHMKNTIHGDLKPGNIILVNDEQGLRPMILDFGTARLVSCEDPDASEIIGSPNYMSPEQALGEPLDARSDIYSLGCVMYEMLSGSRVCDGDKVVEILCKQVNDPALPFSKACPHKSVPIQVEEIVFRALEKQRENRFESMLEMKNALELARVETGAVIPQVVAHVKQMERHHRREIAITVIGVLAIIVCGLVSSGAQLLVLK